MMICWYNINDLVFGTDKTSNDSEFERVNRLGIYESAVLIGIIVERDCWNTLKFEDIPNNNTLPEWGSQASYLGCRSVNRPNRQSKKRGTARKDI